MPVSIVLPYYNPAENWSGNIIERYAQLKQLIGEPIEMILVDDGTVNAIPQSDITAIKDNIPDSIFVSYSLNMGKGHAIRQGVAKATGDIIIYTDIDFPYTTNSICEIYQCLKNEDCDIAMGIKSELYYQHVPQTRKLISKMLRWFIKVFFTIPYTDTQCGLKGFKRKVKQEFLSTTVNRYLFDLEFIRSSYKAGFKINAVPVILNEGITFRKINYRILFPEVINLLKLMLHKP